MNIFFWVFFGREEGEGAEGPQQEQEQEQEREGGRPFWDHGGHLGFFFGGERSYE